MPSFIQVAADAIRQSVEAAKKKEEAARIAKAQADADAKKKEDAKKVATAAAVASGALGGAAAGIVAGAAAISSSKKSSTPSTPPPKTSDTVIFPGQTPSTKTTPVGTTGTSGTVDLQPGGGAVVTPASPKPIVKDSTPGQTTIKVQIPKEPPIPFKPIGPIKAIKGYDVITTVAGQEIKSYTPEYVALQESKGLKPLYMIEEKTGKRFVGGFRGGGIPKPLPRPTPKPSDVIMGTTGEGVIFPGQVPTSQRPSTIKVNLKNTPETSAENVAEMYRNKGYNVEVFTKRSSVMYDKSGKPIMQDASGGKPLYVSQGDYELVITKKGQFSTKDKVISNLMNMSARSNNPNIQKHYSGIANLIARVTSENDTVKSIASNLPPRNDTVNEITKTLNDANYTSDNFRSFKNEGVKINDVTVGANSKDYNTFVNSVADYVRSPEGIANQRRVIRNEYKNNPTITDEVKSGVTIPDYIKKAGLEDEFVKNTYEFYIGVNPVVAKDNLKDLNIKAYKRTGDIPGYIVDQISTQVNPDGSTGVPQQYRDLGLDSKFYDISYRYGLGMIGREDANQELSDSVKTSLASGYRGTDSYGKPINQYNSWAEKYLTFTDESGKEKKFSDIKSKDPAAFLYIDNKGNISTSIETLRWSKEQMASAPIEAKVGKGFAEVVIGGAFNPDFWAGVGRGVYETVTEGKPKKDYANEAISNWAYGRQQEIRNKDWGGYITNAYILSPPMVNVVYPFLAAGAITKIVGGISKIPAVASRITPGVTKVGSSAAGSAIGNVGVKYALYSPYIFTGSIVGADIGTTAAMEQKGLVEPGTTFGRTIAGMYQLGMSGLAMSAGTEWAAGYKPQVVGRKVVSPEGIETTVYRKYATTVFGKPTIGYGKSVQITSSPFGGEPTMIQGKGYFYGRSPQGTLEIRKVPTSFFKRIGVPETMPTPTALTSYKSTFVPRLTSPTGLTFRPFSFGQSKLPISLVEKGVPITLGGPRPSYPLVDLTGYTPRYMQTGLSEFGVPLAKPSIPKPKFTVRSYVDKLISGTLEYSPAQQQFYVNNAKAIEKRIKEIYENVGTRPRTTIFTPTQPTPSITQPFKQKTLRGFGFELTPSRQVLATDIARVKSFTELQKLPLRPTPKITKPPISFELAKQRLGALTTSAFGQTRFGVKLQEFGFPSIIKRPIKAVYRGKVPVRKVTAKEVTSEDLERGRYPLGERQPKIEEIKIVRTKKGEVKGIKAESQQPTITISELKGLEFKPKKLFIEEISPTGAKPVTPTKYAKIEGLEIKTPKKSVTIRSRYGRGMVMEGMNVASSVYGIAPKPLTERWVGISPFLPRTKLTQEIFARIDVRRTARAVFEDIEGKTPTKKELDDFVREIKKVNGKAETYVEEKTMLRKETVLHELLHKTYPKASEDKIVLLTEQLSGIKKPFTAKPLQRAFPPWIAERPKAFKGISIEEEITNVKAYKNELLNTIAGKIKLRNEMLKISQTSVKKIPESELVDKAVDNLWKSYKPKIKRYLGTEIGKKKVPLPKVTLPEYKEVPRIRVLNYEDAKLSSTSPLARGMIEEVKPIIEKTLTPVEQEFLKTYSTNLAEVEKVKLNQAIEQASRDINRYPNLGAADIKIQDILTNDVGTVLVAKENVMQRVYIPATGGTVHLQLDVVTTKVVPHQLGDFQLSELYTGKGIPNEIKEALKKPMHTLNIKGLEHLKYQGHKSLWDSTITIRPGDTFDVSIGRVAEIGKIGGEPYTMVSIGKTHDVAISAPAYTKEQISRIAAQETIAKMRKQKPVILTTPEEEEQFKEAYGKLKGIEKTQKEFGMVYTKGTQFYGFKTQIQAPTEIGVRKVWTTKPLVPEILATAKKEALTGVKVKVSPPTTPPYELEYKGVPEYFQSKGMLSAKNIGVAKFVEGEALERLGHKLERPIFSDIRSQVFLDNKMLEAKQLSKITDVTTEVGERGAPVGVHDTITALKKKLITTPHTEFIEMAQKSGQLSTISKSQAVDIKAATKDIINQMQQSQTVSRAVSSELAKEATTTASVKQISENVQKSVEKQVNDVVTKNVSKQLNRTTSKQENKIISAYVSKQLPKEISKEISKQIPKVIPKVIPQMISKVVPKLIPKIETKLVTKQIPKLIPKVTPAFVPLIVPKVTFKQQPYKPKVKLPETKPQITTKPIPFIFGLSEEKKKQLEKERELAGKKYYTERHFNFPSFGQTTTYKPFSGPEKGKFKPVTFQTSQWIRKESKKK